MIQVYNGYDEKFLTGKELKEMYNNAFFCSGRHHSVVYDVTIPEFLDLIHIKDGEQYRIFYNKSFCKVMRAKTDCNVTFFSHDILSDTLYSDRYKKRSTCPVCGATMKIRRGKIGEFWGCSNYPNCKGTRNILLLGERHIDGFTPYDTIKLSKYGLR